jgi:hypothetical protein
MVKVFEEGFMACNLGKWGVDRGGDELTGDGWNTGKGFKMR